MGLPSGLDENGFTDDSWRRIGRADPQALYNAYIGKFKSDGTYTPVNVAYQYMPYTVYDPETSP